MSFLVLCARPVQHVEKKNWAWWRVNGTDFKTPIPHFETNEVEMVAVCICGTARAIGMRTVYAHFMRYIVKPIKQLNAEIDVFLVLSNGTLNQSSIAGAVALNSEMSCLTVEDVANLWKDADVLMHTDQELRLPKLCISNEIFRRYFLMFGKVHACYQRIKERETANARLYDWIIRMRSDHIIFESLPPLASLNTNFVYVPRGVVSRSPQKLFASDHVFFCPRRLCDAYFQVTPNCANTVSATASGNPWTIGNPWTLPYGVLWMNKATNRATTDSGLVRALSWSFTTVRPNGIECNRLLWNENETRVRRALLHCISVNAQALSNTCSDGSAEQALYGSNSCLCNAKVTQPHVEEE